METVRLVIHARGETHEAALDPEGTIIGRAKPADIVLESRMISRRHVRVFRDPFGRWIFEDLGSSNGTFVHGRRIDACPILPGEPVHIGPFALTITQPQDRPMVGSPPPAYHDVNLLVTDFETEFFQDLRGEPPTSRPCPERWAELTACLSQLTNLTALYPEVCRHLGKTQNTVALILRVPAAPVPLSPKPEVCAVYVGDGPHDAGFDDTVGYYPSLPLALQERAYRLSRRVIEKVRTTREPAMAKTIFSSDTDVTITLIDEFSPRAIICAPLDSAANSIDLLYLDFPLGDAPGGATEEVFAYVRQAAHEVARVHKGLALMELRAGRSILDSELSLARDIQSGLAPFVPTDMGTGLDVAVHYGPVMWVGGDYCDIWSADPRHLAFAVGHVDSIGLPAALTLYSLRLTLRLAADPTRSLPDILTRVNQQFLAHPLHKTSAGLFLGLLDRQKGIIRFVNAAHPQPLVLLPSGWTALGQSGSTKLGTEGATFHEHSIGMQNLASLLLYTPGITHTRSPHADDFGTIGLLRALKGAQTDSAQATVRAVTDAAEAHRGSLARMHDLTVLALTAKH